MPAAFVDHHCHSLISDWATADVPPWPLWRRCFTESTSERVLARDVPDLLGFRHFLRALGKLIGAESAAEREVVTARDRLAAAGPDAYLRWLLDDAGVGALLVDTGYGGAGTLGLAELERAAARPVREVVRIESVAEAVLTAGGTPRGRDRRAVFGAAPVPHRLRRRGRPHARRRSHAAAAAAARLAHRGVPDRAVALLPVRERRRGHGRDLPAGVPRPVAGDPAGRADRRPPGARGARALPRRQADGRLGWPLLPGDALVGRDRLAPRARHRPRRRSRPRRPRPTRRRRDQQPDPRPNREEPVPIAP